MLREEVIKALECCIEDECDKCGCSFGNCQQNLMREALDLIKKLIEECEFHRKTIAENAQMGLEVTLEEIDKTKADTVRKMQEDIKRRCLDKGIYPAVVKRAIEDAAKEILEVKSDEQAD